MATTSSSKSNIQLALEWWIGNPGEKVVTAARIHKCNVNSLQIALKRHRKKESSHRQDARGGHNRILLDYQEQAVLDYIKSQCERGVGATKQMVFNAIAHLKEQEGAPPPSWRWFQTWLHSQRQHIHSIKAKPIARARIQSHTKADIMEWFAKYKAKLQERGIKRGKYIHNFDETGVRVGCPRGEDIIVPIGVNELYTASLEDRTFLSVIESISADGREPPPPTIICLGKRHMENWYQEEDHGEMVALSPTRYTNEEISMIWLHSFIKHVSAGLDSPWRMLLMDGHSSHLHAKDRPLLEEIWDNVNARLGGKEIVHKTLSTGGIFAILREKLWGA